MAEEDETFPPETSKLPTEFAFREFGHLSVATYSEALLNSRNNLLAVANTYGLIFVGYPGGFKVYKDTTLFDAALNEEDINEPQVVADVALRCPPQWIAVSSDNLTLVVCSSSDKGLKALFFDTRNLVNEAKSTKTPFCVYSLSKSTSASVTSLHWNPSVENTHYLAICLTTGGFLMLSVTDSVQQVGNKPDEFGACSACWSPRGKQVMIGKSDGSMQQFTPALEIRRTVPVCDEIDRNVKVDDILWLSTLQVAFSYTPVDTDGEWQPSLFIVTLPPAKEQTKTPSWRNYEDPCYGITGNQPPHFINSYIDKWNLFVVSSSIASETAVIAKNKQTDVWEIWNLDDSSRAQLPMVDGSEEPSPLGAAIIYTAKKRIIVDDTRECDAMPVFAMLSCDGHLCLFHMINLQSEEGYPKLTIQAKELPTDGERAALPNKMGSTDASSSKTIISSKPKLSNKPSVLITTSTPKLHNEQKLSDTSQLSVTPLKSGPGANIDTSNATSSKFIPKALAFSNFSTPVPTAGNSTAPNIPKQPSVPSFGANTNQAEAKPAKFSLEKQFNLPQARETGSPSFDASVTTTSQVKPRESSPFVRPESSISSLSAFSQKGRKATPVDVPSDSGKRRTAVKKAQEKVVSLQSSVSSDLPDNLAAEVTEFECELAAFLKESSSIEQVVDSLGTNNDKSKLRQGIESLSNFKSKIKQTTNEQHSEIQSARSLSLEAYAALQNVETHRKKCENPAYHDALYTRPLDLSDQKKMKEIRGFYHYIKDTVREVNAALDEQWLQFTQKNNKSALHKSKRRMEVESHNSMHKAILTQTKILHDQEMKLTLLGQKLDTLRLMNTEWQLSEGSFSPRHQSSAAGDGADLPTLATSLIRDKRLDRTPTNYEQGDASNKQSPNPLLQISPKKACQLAEFLASRKSTPIRSSSGGKKSRFIAPSFRRKLADAHIASPSVGSRSSRSSSVISTTETEDSETERDSSTSPEQEEEDLFDVHQTYNINAGGIHAEDMSLAMLKPYKLLSGAPSISPFAPATLKKVEPERKIVEKSSTPPPSMSLQGSSTITYGGPDVPVPHIKPLVKFDAASQAEAASNLNHPPKVVNIKELKEPPVVNVIPFSHKFEAKADLPAGVVNEVQKVLNVVHAETRQPTQKLSLLPTSSEVEDDEEPPSALTTASVPTATASYGFSSLSFTQTGGAGTSFGLSSIGRSPASPALGNTTNSQSTMPKKELPPTTEEKPPSKNASSFPSLFNLVSGGDDGSTSPLPNNQTKKETPERTSPLTKSTSATSLDGKPPLGVIKEESNVNLENSGNLKMLAEQNSKTSSSTLSAVTSETELPFMVKSPPELIKPPSEQKTTVEVPSSTVIPPTDQPNDTPPPLVHAAPPSITPAPTEEAPPTSTKDSASSSLFGFASLSAQSSANVPADASTSSTFGQTSSQPGLFTVSLSETTSQSYTGLFQNTTSSASVFGASSAFGTTTASSAPPSGFGAVSSASPSGFAAIPSATPSGFSVTTTANTNVFGSLSNVPGFGFGNLGSAPSTGFGSTPSAPSTGFGSTPSAPSTGFGSTPSAPSTGFGSTPSAPSTGFGSTPSAPSTGFGSTPSAPSTGFGSTPSAPSTGFGSTPSAPSTGFGSTPSAPSTGFGSTPSAPSTGFGSTPTAPSTGFGSLASAPTSGYGSVSAGFSSGFLSGLGSTPSQSTANANPFASAPSTQSADSKSLFGNTGASSFGQTSGFGQTSSTGLFGAKPSEQPQSFGAFSKPAAGGFGSADVFGSPPSFGTKSAFGTASQFGASSGFGSSTGGFGSAAAFGSPAGTAPAAPSGGGFGSSGFGAFASTNSPGFGSLAEQGGGFGSPSMNQPSFGNVQQNAPAFGAEAQKKPSFSGWR